MVKWNKDIYVFMAVVCSLLLLFLVAQDTVYAAPAKTKTEVFIIDRLEGEMGVLETKDGSIVVVSKSLLPKRSKEGDVLNKRNNKYSKDTKATKARWKEIEKLMQDITMS